MSSYALPAATLSTPGYPPEYLSALNMTVDICLLNVVAGTYVLGAGRALGAGDDVSTASSRGPRVRFQCAITGVSPEAPEKARVHSYPSLDGLHWPLSLNTPPETTVRRSLHPYRAVPSGPTSI